MRKHLYTAKKIWKFCPKSILFFILINLANHLLSPLVLYCYKMTISNLEKNNFIKSILYVIIIIFCYILAPFLSGFLQMVQTHMQYSISKNGYSILFQYLSNIDISFFDTKELFVKIERAKKAISNSILTIFVSSSNLIARLISMILVGYMIFKESPLAIFLLLAMGILQNLFLHKTIKDSINLIKKNEIDMRKENYFDPLFKKREYIKEIHLFSISNWLENNRKKYFNKLKEENKKINIKWTKINLFWALIMYILEGLLYIIIFLLLVEDKIEVSGLIFIIQSQETFIQSFTNLIQLFPQIAKELFYIDSLYIMENTSFKKITNSTLQIIKNRKIIISKVYFKYNNKFVLKNVNLEILKGDKIVIVGENGCGKSTLIKLISGLLYPNSGTIINTANKIGVVFQDYAKFYTTIRENIAFGSLKDLNNDSKLEEILKISMGKKFANQYNDLEIGLSPEFFENSIDLSGGEWQKIAIARCIASDADLIVLDESTSALDPLTEKLHYNLFNTIFKEKTIIMITHHLNVLLLADKIAFMKNGEIIEFGSHSDLISKKGDYFSFINNALENKRILV